MSELSLLKNHQYGRCSDAVAAGTGTTKGSGVDCAGGHCVLFQVLFGAIVTTSVVTVKLQHSDTDVDGNYVDIDAGASFVVADSEDNKIALAEVIRPAKRWVRIVVTVATANATIDGITFELAKGKRTLPVTQPSTVTNYGNISQISGQDVNQNA